MSIYFLFKFVLLASFGALIRFYLSQFNYEFPWMTLLVNVLGCFLIGIIYSLKMADLVKPGLWVLFVVAFLGALTTFSSFSLEVIKLFSQKSYLLGISYFFISNILGLTLCYAGYCLGQRIAA